MITEIVLFHLPKGMSRTGIFGPLDFIARAVQCPNRI
jgi:hypothetical protein